MKKEAILIGLIGTGIQKSVSPELHMREAELLGLRYIYRLIDLTQLGLELDALSDLLTAAERLGFDGLAVTHPCKQVVIPHLTELSEDARALEAVNTVLLRNGKRIGHNTDWSGFAEAFRHGMGDVKLGRVVQLGAGGAGSAVAYAGLTLGFETLVLFDMDRSRAQHVVDSLNARFGEGRAVVGDDLEAEVAMANGLVNATPIGMFAHPGIPLPARLLRSDLWIADLIYAPRETELLREARALGAKGTNGGGMVAYQAADQIRLYTGMTPDAERMRAHFDEL